MRTNWRPYHPHRLMYLINNSNFSPPNDGQFGQCSNHHHHFQQCNHQLTASPISQPTTHLSHQNHLPTNLNHHHNATPPPNSHIRNSASYTNIVSNKPSPATGPVPHHSATNLATTANSALLCFNCKNHPHHSSSVNKLSNTSLATGSSQNIYNRNKLEQSLLEAKLRVAQLKKELQSSKLKTSNQYLNNGSVPIAGQCNGTVSASSGSISNEPPSQDQVDFGSSRESQIRMLNSYMQEAVESVYGSQSNSRHSSQQQLALPLIKQGLSSSSISTDSLRNSTSSVHLNACGHPSATRNQPASLSHNYHPYLQINHQQCNHQISTSDSCQSITENIYSNQQIINNLNKSKSANTINTINYNTGNSASNLAAVTATTPSSLAGRRPSASLLENGQVMANRQSVVSLKKDSPDELPVEGRKNGAINCENFVIYSNQSAILAQQKQKQLEISQKALHSNLPYSAASSDGQLAAAATAATGNATATIDESFNLLSIIDKYYRKNDSTAVEV